MHKKSTILKLEEYLHNCNSDSYKQYEHLSGAGATFLFEEKLRIYFSKKYAVTFSSATTALQSLCIALNINNTEIITSPLNWGGSIAPFLLWNNLRFISVNPETLNMSFEDLSESVTQKTKAVLSVDFNGIPVDSKAIRNICKRNDLIFISDGAQSFGSYLNSKPASYFASAIVLSFSPGKSLFSGEGGAVITDDENIYKNLLWNSMHVSRQKAVFGLGNYNEYAPINGRLNPLSAILLNENFDASLDRLKQYQVKCFHLLRCLQDNKLIEATPHIPHSSSSTFFGFIVNLSESSSLKVVSEFLKCENQPFIASEYSLRFIPFDALFRYQFRRRFTCSESLMEQKKTMQTHHLLKLTYMPLIAAE